MKIDKIPVGTLGTNCYLIYDENLKEGIVVDPGADGDVINGIIKSKEVNVKYMVFTHVHFDHILAYFDIKKEFPDAKLIVCEKEKDALKDDKKSLLHLARINCPAIECDLTVKDGDFIKFGNEKLKVIETPGHTAGSMSLYDDGVLISGDTLFKYSIGRCDFPTGSLKEETNSILNILFRLPEETVVYPGHGETTFIGFEKENNEVYSWL